MRPAPAILLLGTIGACTPPSPARDSAPTDDPTDSGAVPQDSGDTTPPLPECAPMGAEIQHQIDLLALLALDEPPASSVGLAAGDFDGDGHVDLWLSTGRGGRILRGDGAGGLDVWTAVQVGQLDPGTTPGGLGAAAADYDGDGDLDLALARKADTADMILRNDGGGVFSPLQLTGSEAEGSAPAWLDLDGDGREDLFIGRTAPNGWTAEELLAGTAAGAPNGAWRQLSDGSFAPWTAAQPADMAAAWTLAPTPLDADGDGDLDLYLANDSGPYIVPSALLENNGEGALRTCGDCGTTLENFGMGVAVGDANADGRADLYITDVGSPDLLMGLDDGGFAIATAALGAEIPPANDRAVSWGTRFVDLDANGRDDLVVGFGPSNDENSTLTSQNAGVEGVVEGQRDAVLLAQEGGFADVSVELGLDSTAAHRAVVVLDLDEDHRPELALMGREELLIWAPTQGCPSWLAVVPTREDGQFARGVRVHVQAEGVSNHQWALIAGTGASSEPKLFAGLGLAESATVRVDWLDGSQDTWNEVPAGSLLAARQGQGE